MAWYNRSMQKPGTDRKTKRENPFLFQGDLRREGYFEGWYYKQVNAMRDQTISVIFGVSVTSSDPHAFVQILLTKPVRTYYFHYPIESFRQVGDRFWIGNNQFSQRQVHLELRQDGFECIGTLDYQSTTPLKRTRYMPSIMGPFAYLDHMECNHGVVSMNHRVNGRLSINDEFWLFSRDTGYIEKDWGKSFPKRYIWMQGNNFKTSEASVMVSIAHIPFLGLSFEGIIAEVSLPNRSIRIATYLGARRESLVHTQNGFTLTLRQGRLRILIEAKMDQVGELKSPKHGVMKDTIKEGLGGTINVTLQRRNKTIWEDRSTHCGIEIEGYK